MTTVQWLFLLLVGCAGPGQAVIRCETIEVSVEDTDDNDITRIEMRCNGELDRILEGHLDER